MKSASFQNFNILLFCAHHQTQIACKILWWILLKPSNILEIPDNIAIKFIPYTVYVCVNGKSVSLHKKILGTVVFVYLNNKSMLFLHSLLVNDVGGRKSTNMLKKNPREMLLQDVIILCWENKWIKFSIALPWPGNISYNVFYFGFSNKEINYFKCLIYAILILLHWEFLAITSRVRAYNEL